MNYYYDVNLNFLEDNYSFYEWEENDDIKRYRKVAIFQVNDKTLKDFINNNVLVKKEFLDSIKNGDTYIALFASVSGVLALEFNDNGISINRSYLQMEDELNIYDILYSLPISKISYTLVNQLKYQSIERQESRIKKIIKTEINSLCNVNNYTKVRYLYKEWFNKDGKSINSMKAEMEEKLNDVLSDNELKIYELIKLSYSKV